MAVATGVILLVLGIFGADQVSALESQIVELLQSLPSWGEQLFGIAYAIGSLYALALVVVVLVGGKKRRQVLRDLVAALAVGTVLALLLTRVVHGTWPSPFPLLTEASTEFPLFRVVAVTATLTTAAPHLIRPMRRLGWVLVTLVVVSGMGLGFGFPSDAIGGIGLGVVAAGAVLLLFGSPRGYPDPVAVAHALEELGVEATGLRIAPDQSWGARLLVGSAAYGPVAIKAYGRDATESQFFAKLWRSVWFRDTGPSISFSRLHGVEHEALMTMLAAREGVAAPAVLAAGEPGEDVALLVIEQRGRPLRDLDPSSIADGSLVALWEDVARLHRASIAHGNLSSATVYLSGDGHVITDFSSASLAAPQLRIQSDVAELMFSLAAHISVGRTARTALAGLGTENLVEALPYLQLAAVTPNTRKDTDEPQELIKRLQEESARLTGTELPVPAPIRRVTPRQIVMTSLMLLAAYALISMLAGIDWASVWNEIADAHWAWIAAAFVLGQATVVFEATAMVAAVGEPLPFRPVLVLQLASKYVGLAVPGAAGRIAANTTFLRRFGVSPVAAVTQGSLDTLSGFLVEISVLALVLLFGDFSLSLDSGDRDWGVILAIVVSLIVVGVVVARRLQKVREWVAPVVKEVAGALKSLISSPRRAFDLLASNVLSRLILGVTLAMVLVALNSPIGVAAALVVAVLTNLLAGLAPVPGGIGVAEAVLTAGLVAVGVGDDTAFAAAVVYRMITFYIPSAVGWYAVKWEEARGYL